MNVKTYYFKKKLQLILLPFFLFILFGTQIREVIPFLFLWKRQLLKVVSMGEKWGSTGTHKFLVFTDAQIVGGSQFFLHSTTTKTISGGYRMKKCETPTIHVSVDTKELRVWNWVLQFSSVRMALIFNLSQCYTFDHSGCSYCVTRGNEWLVAWHSAQCSVLG